MKDLLPPRENPDLRGHEEAEKILLDGFHGGRLAHAWLISGPRGIGKGTLAYRFARYVLVHGGPGSAAEPETGPGLFGDETPADGAGSLHGSLYVAPENPVFRRIAAGGHSDFIGVERTLNDKGKLRSEIVVDDVRAVGRFFSMTPGEGGWRVVVIDSADEMNTSAANAVLKVLEEPPARALLLLVSHNPGRLLATIRSRCRKLALQPLAPDSVASMVQGWRRPGLNGEDALSLATLADGSPGRALALVGEGGLELYRDMMALLETLPRLDIAALHALSGRLGKSGADGAFRTASGLLRWWLARMIMAAAGGGNLRMIGN